MCDFSADFTTFDRRRLECAARFDPYVESQALAERLLEAESWG
jgi:hypothetical protein